MKVNTTQNIQITVSLKSDPTITEQIVFPIQVLSDVHSVQILGGNRQQQFSQSFNLEGKVDDPNLSPNEKISLKETNYGINIKWQCINMIIGDDCRDSQNNLIISDVTQNLQITIQQKTLQPFQQYQFILSGTKDGITVFDQIIISIIDNDFPSVQSNISINNSQNRINLNQEIFIQFYSEEVTNVDNLIITGVIFYQNQQKNIITLGYNQFIFQVWELFFDFLDQKQNEFELKFSIRNINYIVPTLISYTLYANIPPQQCIFDQTTDYKVRNLQDKITLQINECNDANQPLSYSFYFYKNQEQYDNEILNAQQHINRNLLSDFSLKNNIETVLPFGVSLIMGVIQDSKGGIRNITQQITVSQYDQDSSSYYKFINSWFVQTKQKQQNENKVIQYNMIIQDIINHKNILQLDSNTQFIQLYINILNEIQYQQTFFINQMTLLNIFYRHNQHQIKYLINFSIKWHLHQDLIEFSNLLNLFNKQQSINKYLLRKQQFLTQHNILIIFNRLKFLYYKHNQ
ncbi:hypothetical protein IMG5_000010, partial [Ichthyophthirius multifiliis]